MISDHVVIMADMPHILYAPAVIVWCMISDHVIHFESCGLEPEGGVGVRDGDTVRDRVTSIVYPAGTGEGGRVTCNNNN